MGLSMQKFLNTVTHFSKSTYQFQELGFSQGFGTSRFYSLFGRDGNNATEADVQQAVGEQIRVVQAIINVPTGFNTLNGNTVVRLRDDLASVGDIINIGAGIDGKIIATLATPPTIAANSLCDTLVDTTASGAGTLRIESIQWIYERVLN